MADRRRRATAFAVAALMVPAAIATGGCRLGFDALKPPGTAGAPGLDAAASAHGPDAAGGSGNDGGSWVGDAAPLPSAISCPHLHLGQAEGSPASAGPVQGTVSARSGTCGGADGVEVQLGWRAPRAGLYEFNTRGSDFDTVLYALPSSCASPEHACNDDSWVTGAGRTSSIAVEVDDGEELLLVVDSFGYGASDGSYQLNVHEKCAGKHLGSALGPAVATGSMSAHASSLAGSCGGEGEAEIVFSWTAPADGLYEFSTLGSDFDTVLYLRDGSCEGAELACNDDAGGSHSAVVRQLAAGQTVLVVIDTFGGAARNYALNVQSR